MALLFYTTEYKPERAQAEIQQQLLGLGARRISIEYDAKRAVIGMSFTLATPVGEREFLLPARVDRVRATLERQGVLKWRTDDGASHAAQVAWRTLLEWVKIQAAIAQTKQAAPDEIMLPYLVVGTADNPHATLYEEFSSDKALPAGRRSAA